jgi:hypothetical protein
MKKLSAWLTAIIMALGLGLLVRGPPRQRLPTADWPGARMPKSNQAMRGGVSHQRALGKALLLRPPGDRYQRGRPTGYTVRYVSKVVQDGSGLPIKLRGGAFLQVTAHSPSYDSATGKATFVPANRSEVTNVSKYQTFRQVAWAGSFEGRTTLGLGVRARLPVQGPHRCTVPATDPGS